MTAYLGYRSARTNLTDRAFSQLTSLRASKSYQIEAYIQTIRNHVQTLSEDPSVVAAMRDFNATYGQLETVAPPADGKATLTAYYQTEFLPRLAKTGQGTPVLGAFLPDTSASSYLQYHYIADNPNPVGQKDALDQANDGSAYSQVHGRLHPTFRNIIQNFGYYDMFLINRALSSTRCTKKLTSPAISPPAPTTRATWLAWWPRCAAPRTGLCPDR